MKDNTIDLKFSIIADFTGQLERTYKLKLRVQLKMAVKQKNKCNFAQIKENITDRVSEILENQGPKLLPIAWQKFRNLMQREL